MKRTTEYRQTKLSFSRAVIYGLSPIPQKEVFYDATGGPFTHTKVEFLMELYDKEGIAGVIPCTSLMEERLLPLVLTGEERTFEEWSRFLYWKYRNNGLAGETVREIGRFEFALLDLISKRAGLPAHRFLGSDKDWVPVYGSGGSTHLEGLSLAKEMEGFLSHGHRIVKMKVGTDFGTRLDRDVERVKLARGVIGPDVGLALDANQVFTVGQALEFAKRVEEYDIAWYEEPLHSLDYFGYRDLAEQCPIPVSSGESFYNHYMFQPLLETKVRHFQPVAASFDGIEDWFEVNAMAKECGAVISSGGLPMLSAVMIANAGENAIVEFLEPCNQPLLDYMDIRVERKDGRFYFPDAAGLPCHFDMGRLDKEGFLKSKKIIGA